MNREKGGMQLNLFRTQNNSKSKFLSLLVSVKYLEQEQKLSPRNLWRII